MNIKKIIVGLTAALAAAFVYGGTLTAFAADSGTGTNRGGSVVGSFNYSYSGAGSSNLSNDSTGGWLVTSSSFAELFNEEINDTCDDIVKATQGINRDGSVNEDKLVIYDAKGALNGRIVKAAMENPTANVFVDYVYEGIRFRSAITPDAVARAYSEDIPWYGPCFLASNFPTMILGTVEQ